MGSRTARAEPAGVIDPGWYTRMASFLGGFPQNYLVFDCETNGVKERSRETLPVDLGWCMVKGCVPVHRNSFLINWALHPKIDAAWFERSVRETAQRMAEKGDPHVGWARLRDEGLDPREVMPLFREFLEESQDNGYYFVGHNAYGFDRPIVENATYTATGDMFRFDYRLFVDTGMIEKANSAGIAVPEPGEQHTFRWYESVRGTVIKGKWKLSLCAQKYGLVEKYGLDLAEAHNASFDCHMTHLLLEAYRELADGIPPDDIPF